MAQQPFSASPEIKVAWKKYAHLWKREEAGARQVLLGEGDVCRKIYFVEKGCIRNWFYHDGKEISFQFFLREMWFILQTVFGMASQACSASKQLNL